MEKKWRIEFDEESEKAKVFNSATGELVCEINELDGDIDETVDEIGDKLVLTRYERMDLLRYLIDLLF